MLFSDCRVLNLHRLEAVQNMHILYRFVGNADKSNLWKIIYVTDFEGFFKGSGGERGIRITDAKEISMGKTIALKVLI